MNGLYYVLSSLVYFVDLPALRETLQMVQALDGLKYQTFTASFSLLFGAMTILVGVGLYKQLRLAWLWTVVLLFLLLAMSLMSGVYNEVFFASLVVFGLLLLSRAQFTRSIGVFSSGSFIAITSIIFAMGYGVVGVYLLRHEYNGVHSWIDAIYFAVVSYSTVGYGDITPKTEIARLFTSSMILVGLSSFATAIAVYLGPFMEKRMKEIFSVFSKLDHVKGHYVICGHNAVSEYLVETFKKQGLDCVVVDPTLEPAEVQDSKHVTYIKGDPTDRATLKSCSIRRSLAVLSTMNNDADNILIALTTNSIRQEKESETFKIIVSINKQENIENAKHVGADEVMTPAKIYSDMLVSKVQKTS